MIKKLIFIRGLPSSGKSTLSLSLEDKHVNCFVYSTDDYWMRPDGVYDFNFELLSESHKWNQSRAFQTLNDYAPYNAIVVIDNTNITFNEMKPYIKMGLECGYDIEFIEPNTPWRYNVEECFERSKLTHKVPYATILKMSQRWEDHETVVAKLEELKSELRYV